MDTFQFNEQAVKYGRLTENWQYTSPQTIIIKFTLKGSQIYWQLIYF